jgi:ATP-dependent RNA helicase DHX29
MAPKKKLPASKQKQKQKPKASSSSAAPAAPRLQISSENERRLRRLLLNSSTTAVPAQAPSEGQAVRSESREQKSRRLRGVYDKLALEGFSSAQIEQALSALSVRIPVQIYNVVTGRN